MNERIKLGECGCVGYKIGEEMKEWKTLSGKFEKGREDFIQTISLERSTRKSEESGEKEKKMGEKK